MLHDDEKRWETRNSGFFFADRVPSLSDRDYDGKSDETSKNSTDTRSHIN